MSAPFFTVAIPTKNRPDRARDAVRSVLDQSFGDFEIIVCDNSDPERNDTGPAISTMADPRVRYLRTSGVLSMPDNWEHAIAQARGEYVGILTDRSVYHRGALQRVHDEIRLSGTQLVGWAPDRYGRSKTGRDFWRRLCSGERKEFRSEDVLRYFLNGHPKHSNKLLPKLMTAMCARRVLDDIRQSAVGRVCPPVAPDFTSGVLMLLHTDQIVLLDDTLFVSCGQGTGSSFRRRTDLAQSFRADLGMTWSGLVDRMPTGASFSHALVLNDLMRIKGQLPERTVQYELNRRQYYLGCLLDYVAASRHGADRAEDYDLLIDGLNREPDDIQRDVRSRLIYLEALLIRPPELDPSTGEQEDEAVAAGELPLFDTVFDALDWAERTPRPRRASNFDVLPSIDDLRKAKAPRHKRKVAGEAA